MLGAKAKKYIRHPALVFWAGQTWGCMQVLGGGSTAQVESMAGVNVP